MDDVLKALAEVVEARMGASPAESYVASLHAGGIDAILSKVGEEAVEVIIAGKGGERDALVHEVADLWFHCLVLLAARGSHPEAVTASWPGGSGSPATRRRPAADDRDSGGRTGFALKSPAQPGRQARRRPGDGRETAQETAQETAMGISIWQLLIVLVIVLLLFGTKKLRNMGGDLGAAIRNFKGAVKEGGDEAKEAAETARIEEDAEPTADAATMSAKERESA